VARAGELAIAAALIGAVAWTYRAVAGFDFVQFDDTVYVLENPIVRSGLTREGVAAAFTSFHTGNWIPLTWLSHMLDVQWFGLAPGRHHLVNAALHALNACCCSACCASRRVRCGRPRSSRPPSRCTRRASSRWPGSRSARSCSPRPSRSDRRRPT
jgi:hypothetical protein